MPTEYQLNIAVCDDTESDRIRIAEMTEQILADEGIACSVTGYESAGDLFTAIQHGSRFHIFLLDVVMNGMDGMEFATLLRQQKNKSAVIFISSNLEMALRGYEVSAARFLAKPLEAEKLKEALLHCHRGWQEKKEILLPTKQGQHRISLSDIQFVEAFDRGTRFVLMEESVDTKLKFSEVEAMLPKSAFILCHRAFIVNIACIKRIRPYEFEMRSGAVVAVSRHRYYEINKMLMDYITD